MFNPMCRSAGLVRFAFYTKLIYLCDFAIDVFGNNVFFFVIIYRSHLVIYHFCHVDLSLTHTHSWPDMKLQFNDRDTFFTGLYSASLSVCVVLQHRNFNFHCTSYVLPTTLQFWGYTLYRV